MAYHTLSIHCKRCKADNRYYCKELPPKIAICAQCQIPLALIAYDPDTLKCTFRVAETK